MDNASDSDDTIILPLNDDLNEPSDTEIENILKKYSSISSSVESKASANSRDDFYNLDSPDEDLVDVPLVKRVRKSSENDKINYEINGRNKLDVIVNSECFGMGSSDILKELQGKYSSSTSGERRVTVGSNLIVLSDSSDAETNNKDEDLTVDKYVKDAIVRPFGDENDEDFETLSPKARAKMERKKEADRKKMEKAKERQKKKEESERLKAMKNLEKEKKKEAAEQQKALKTALKSVERSVKPDESIKNMIVEVDNEILEATYGPVLKAVLANNEISFKPKSQIVSKLISWRRKQQTIDNMLVKDIEVSEKNILLVMSLEEFTNIVRNNSLTQNIRQTIEITCCKQLSLAIFGTNTGNNEQEFAVMEAQLFTKCYIRFVKNDEDLAGFVVELTKAVAQIPYKLKKEEKYLLQSEYLNDCNKDTVSVDKNGNGLGRVWQQMLTMFPLARLETAEAITAVYPTPFSLFKAYESCTTPKEKLLQELPIRRAIGPCALGRRLGPELSRKCFNVFCSSENVLL